jgi:hypothetical protein
VQFFSPALFSRQNAAFCEVLADGDVLDGLDVDVPSAKALPVNPTIAMAAPRVVIRIDFLHVNLPSDQTGTPPHSSTGNISYDRARLRVDSSARKLRLVRIPSVGSTTGLG